jgi:hypothetical protein
MRFFQILAFIFIMAYLTFALRKCINIDYAKACRTVCYVAFTREAGTINQGFTFNKCMCGEKIKLPNPMKQN